MAEIVPQPLNSKLPDELIDALVVKALRFPEVDAPTPSDTVLSDADFAPREKVDFSDPVAPVAEKKSE